MRFSFDFSVSKVSNYLNSCRAARFRVPRTSPEEKIFDERHSRKFLLYRIRISDAILIDHEVTKFVLI